MSRLQRVRAGRWLLGCLLLTASCASPAASSPPASDTSHTTARAVTSTLAPTAVPPTPTAAPTPIPEPQDFATADGGWYFGQTGFTVQDEPNGPQFWAAFQKLGGTGTLGMPTSKVFDGPNGSRVQTFQKGWLTGAPGTAAAQPGQGNPPPAPAEAKSREDRPGMAFIGRVDEQPKEARQGVTVMLRVWAPSAQRVMAVIEQRNLELAKLGDAFVGFYAFHRLARLGARPVRYTLVDESGKTQVRNDPTDTIQVIDGGYPTENIVIDSATLGLLDPVEVNKEETLLNGIFSKWTPDKLWTGPFRAPVDEIEVTSGFGTRRSYNGGPVNDAHEGTDFAVKVGDAVKAAADGRVVFAGPVHVRGNIVLVDHGLGVMSGYFHMSQIEVQEGQDLKQGDEVGKAGATGFVTGPHLHFEIRVQNVNVEPLEWLQIKGFENYARRDLTSA